MKAFFELFFDQKVKKTSHLRGFLHFYKTQERALICATDVNIALEDKIHASDLNRNKNKGDMLNHVKATWYTDPRKF